MKILVDGEPWEQVEHYSLPKGQICIRPKKLEQKQLYWLSFNREYQPENVDGLFAKHYRLTPKQAQAVKTALEEMMAFITNDTPYAQSFHLEMEEK